MKTQEDNHEILLLAIRKLENDRGFACALNSNNVGQFGVMFCSIFEYGKPEDIKKYLKEGIIGRWCGKEVILR